MSLQECGLNLSHSRKELQPHGTIDFPCAGYEALYTKNTADIIPWHWHEELEIVYIKEGTLKLQVPSQKFVMNSGDLAIINTNILHYAAAFPYCKLQSFVFSSLLLTGSSASAFALKYMQPLLSCSAFSCIPFHEEHKNIAESFCIAFDALRSDSFGYEFIVREQLSHIVLSAFKLLENQIRFPQQAVNLDALRLEQMLEYIHNHYAENITLADISNASGIGERECLRCFKRTIGESPIQYLLKYRLMQSADMLLCEPSASISDIASACGFDYSSYYSKQFKRFYQCSPREYRLRI